MFHASIGADPQKFFPITTFLGKLNKAFHDKIAGRQSEPKKRAFSLMDVISLWDREHPLGCEGKSNPFSSHSKIPCLFQLSSPAFSCFLPLFQISSDSKVPEKSRMANLLKKNSNLEMCDILLDFELNFKLKVTESPLSYTSQLHRLESETTLSIYIPYYMAKAGLRRIRAL